MGIACNGQGSQASSVEGMIHGNDFPCHVRGSLYLIGEIKAVLEQQS